MTDTDVWYVCDDQRDAATHADVVVTWNAFTDGAPDTVSLPSILRTERDHYRATLLNCFRRIETAPHGDSDLIGALRLGNDTSYWWMTLVFAKRWGDFGVLADAAKVLAFADLLVAQQPKLIIVALSNERARRSVEATARLNGIACQTKSRPSTNRRDVAWIRATRWLLVSFRPKRRPTSNNHYESLIADYLFRVDSAALASGMFQSQYWAHLPELLERGVLWLHRFTPHPAIATRRHARRHIRRFNASSPHDHHVLLDDVHGFHEAQEVLTTYRAIRRLRRVPVATTFRTEIADLWPIFEDDWRNSFRGSHAMSMAILMTSLEATVASMRGVKRGLYIWENQPWEFALSRFWRRNHAAPLVGVAHSTIRHWDLRYFVDSNTLADPRFDQPDAIAVNSEGARQALIAGGWATEPIHVVEALMYLYLGESAPHGGTDIVVLGELDHTSTQRYLDFVKAAANSSLIGRTVVFKAHPLVGATGFDFGEVAFEITTDSVAQLLRRAGVLITGSSGSTVLEALSQGIPTLCVLDPAELDMSTIRDHDLLQTVGTADEFHRSLNHLLRVPASAHLTENFFHVEPTLARWRKLLRLVDSPK